MSSNFEYSSAPGFGQNMINTFHYNQAVRLGDYIKISGQGGWDPNLDTDTPPISADAGEEIAQAFSNVDKTLRHAGGRGWSEVYSVRAYLCPLTPESMKLMKGQFDKWCGDNYPIYTVVGVVNLGLPTMHVEIEAEAMVGKK